MRGKDGITLRLENLFEKKTYTVDTLALKWDLDTKKATRRLVRYLKRWRKGVLDWDIVEQNPAKLIQDVAAADVLVLAKWLHRCLRVRGYLQVGYPTTSYDPHFFSDRIWMVEGQYRFKVNGIKRDEHLDKRFDKNTNLMLPEGMRTFELAILKEEPTVEWTKGNIPR